MKNFALFIISALVVSAILLAYQFSDQPPRTKRPPIPDYQTYVEAKQ